jgi:endonuclease/exonuclease/phosphatase family metal-dependent hydrolase
MRIVSLNTWKCDGDYRHRLGLMAEGLATLAPDLLLLQEVFATDDGQADTAAFLASTLSMHVAAVPARRKHRMFEGQSCLSTSGLAVLSRQAIKSWQALDLPCDEADGERIALLASVSHRGQDLWLANLHLTHLPEAGALRARQLEYCLEALQPLAGAGPFVIGGDFNASPGSAEFDQMLQAPWRLINPFAGQAKATHCNDAGQEMDLDHLLLSHHWATAKMCRAFIAMKPDEQESGKRPSDHAAVGVELPDKQPEEGLKDRQSQPDLTQRQPV